MKFTAVTVLLFAASALATNVSYSCRYKTGGVDGKGGNANRAGKTKVTTQQGDDIVAHMESWSDNKYTAAKSKHSDNVVVKCKEEVDTKTEATNATEEQAKIVKDHI